MTTDAPPSTARGLRAESLARGRGRKRWSPQAWVLIVVLGFMVVAPLVQLQLRALEDGAAGYQRMFATRGLGETILTTVQLGVGATLIALVAGTALAWSSFRLSRRLQWLSLLPILPIVVPPVAGILGWATLLAPTSGMVNQWIRALDPFGTFTDVQSGPIDVFTTPWITIIVGVQLTSFVYIFIRSGLSELDYGLVEAARLAGASPGQAFFTVVLPLIRPSLVYASATTILLGLGQFAAPLMLGTRDDIRVLTTEVYRATSSPPVDYGAGAALATPLLFVGLAAVVYQRWALRSVDGKLDQSGSKGIGRGVTSSRPAAVGLAAYSFVAVVLPLGALVVVSLSNFWTGEIDLARMSLQNYVSLFESPNTTAAIRTSVIVSLVSVLIALPLGYWFSMVALRERTSRVARVLMDTIVGFPLGIPAVVFGAGFLFTYSSPPLVLYGSSAILIVAYVTLMLPYTTRLQMAARMALPVEYESAARVSGASGWRIHFDILVPMLRQSIASAGLLMFVLLSHEFAASLLVRSPRMQVMGTRFYDLWVNEPYPLVAAMGIVMCAITAVGVGLALKLGGRRAVENL